MTPRKEWQGRVASWQAVSGIEQVTRQIRETYGISVSLEGPDVPAAHDGRRVRVEIKSHVLARDLGEQLIQWAKVKEAQTITAKEL